MANEKASDRSGRDEPPPGGQMLILDAILAVGDNGDLKGVRYGG